MAQRDEGLDKLEAFIAAAAQVRAGLQRDDARVKELGESLREYFGDVEARLEDLDGAIEAFDARYGDGVETYVTFLIVVQVIPLVTFGGAPLVPLVILAAVFLPPELRKQVLDAADNAIVAYRALSDASERLDGALARAGEEAEEAFEEYEETMAAFHTEALEPWLPILAELGPALQGHFLEH